MKFALPEKRCWAVPFEGKQNGEPFYNALNRLYPVIHQAGWGIGYEYGLFCQWGKNGRDQFLYVELLGGSGAPSPAITRIPAGEYFCVKTGQSDMENAPEYFPELFAADYERTLVEVELYVGDYDLQNPDFELRCSAPSGGF